ncbi:hypothetical protein SDC9_128999 [bioreactor metagenome]|uniref:Uncharacterized protein n=1 Tax=bioreactor metagenome TaxID=1076179 RepID=A0A645CYH8_9ZZZZ
MKNLIAFGDILSAIGSTYDINQTPSIIGKTLELYDAKEIGSPNTPIDVPASFAVLTIVTNVG